MAAKFTLDFFGGYNVERRNEYVGSLKGTTFTGHWGDTLFTIDLPYYYSFRGIQNRIGRILNELERTGKLDKEAYYKYWDEEM